MLLELTPHPDTPCEAVTKLEVDVRRLAPSDLFLQFIVTGDIAALHLAPQLESTRADDLWMTTCFEAFLLTGYDEGYIEINLSPSNRWAAYCFDNYREGMAKADAVLLHHPFQRADTERYEIGARAHLGGFQPDAPWRLGLSAVIEETNGRKSYWALAHAPDKPDFHHPDSFACVLEPA
jgi:hypothetical protein